MRGLQLVTTMAPLLALSFVLGQEAPPELTQQGMTEAANERLVSAEAEMQQVFDALLQRGTGKPAALAKLRKAQAAWEAYRDAQLEALWPMSDGSDGSAEPMCVAIARITLTDQRVRELRAMAVPLEGDVCRSQWPE